MQDPKFHNKNGTLTHYAFACGYIEMYDTKIPYNYASLSKDGIFHVKGFAHGNHFWDCYDTLTEARKGFQVRKQEVKGIKQFSGYTLQPA